MIRAARRENDHRFADKNEWPYRRIIWPAQIAILQFHRADLSSNDNRLDHGGHAVPTLSASCRNPFRRNQIAVR